MLAKKSLGQNFLNHPKIVNDIVASANLTKPSHVLEIGPGTGMLTEVILAKGHTITAVETDDRLIPILREKFSSAIESGKLHLHAKDIREYDIQTLQAPYHVIANIPYYITGLLFRKFLEHQNQPSSITFIVQKQVAQRITAHTNKESILSLSVKVFGTPKRVQNIPARFFTPSPKVDSAILHIQDISRKNFTSIAHEQAFFILIKQGFKHKRKTLQNNLSLLFTKPQLHTLFLEVSLPKNVRAEDIALQTWLDMAQKAPLIQ